MEREFKFRAWDESRMKMIYHFHERFWHPDKYRILFTEEERMFCGNYMDNGDWQEPKLMQYTGLKDKNGKEIYEHDVLCFEGQYHYQVVFQDAKFVCLHALQSNSINGMLWGALHRFFDPDFLVYSGIEVIGNKFQNPELINKADGKRI